MAHQPTVTAVHPTLPRKATPQTGPTWSPRRIGRLARALAATTHLEVGVLQRRDVPFCDSAYRTGVDPDFRLDVDEVRDRALTILVGTTSNSVLRRPGAGANVRCHLPRWASYVSADLPRSMQLATALAHANRDPSR